MILFVDHFTRKENPSASTVDRLLYGKDGMYMYTGWEGRVKIVSRSGDLQSGFRPGISRERVRTYPHSRRYQFASFAKHTKIFRNIDVMTVIWVRSDRNNGSKESSQIH